MALRVALPLLFLGLLADLTSAGESCPAGHYLGTSGTCVRCLAGTYKENEGNHQCEACPPGSTTAEDGAYTRSLCLSYNCTAGYFPGAGGSCSPCPRGFYRDLRAPTCVHCGSGQTTDQEASTNITACRPEVVENTCVEGQYFRGQECLLCPANTYQDTVRQDSCKPCPTGSSTQGELGRTKQQDCIQDVANLCLAGERLTSAGCSPCPVNTYQNNSGQTSCTSCPQGLITLGTGSKSADDCVSGFVQCQAGQFRNSLGRCEACAKGTYSVGQEAGSCTSCPFGETTVRTGSSNSSACVAICPRGTFRDGSGRCPVCPKGTFSETPESISCTQCSPGTTTPNAGTSDGRQCADANTCPVGHYLWGNRDCRPCRKGSYQPDVNQVDCISCSIELTTRQTGSISSQQCVESCVPGYFVTGENCTKCPMGEYQHQNDRDFCYKCAPGMITLTDGTPHISGCIVPCVEGQFFQSTGCEVCPVGMYQSQRGQRSCDSCQTGYTTDSTGATSREQCRALCEVGSYLLANGQCSQCATGTYQPLQSQTECLSCPRGLTTRQAGSTNITQCVVICQPGHYPFGSTCVPCALGTYQNEPDQQQCKVCPQGQTTRVTGAVLKTACVPLCQPGSFVSGDQCVSCPVGQYQFQGEQDRCIECSAGFTTAGPGASNVSQCIRVCVAGHYMDSGGCRECKLGTYQPLPDAATCLNCSAGYTTQQTGSMRESDCVEICSPGYVLQSLQCVACGLGFYQSSSGQTSCIPCPDGQSTTSTASSSDQDCVEICRPGTYLVDRKCTACPQGQYQPDPARSECLECPTNLTTRDTGSVNRDDCLIFCPAGQYWDRAQRVCQVCVQGMYSSSSGMLQCTQCAEGFSTEGTGADSADKCYELCKPGSFLNSEKVCEPCALGSYKTSIGFASCTSCGPNRTTENPGSSSGDACHPLCPAGSFLSQPTDTCSLCALGYYQPNQGQRSCEQCIEGHTTVNTGSTAQSQCILQCPPGYQALPSGVSCSPCERGFFKQNLGPEQCSQCRTGYVTSAVGATSAANCTVPNCGPGTYISGDSCSNCEVGRYQSNSWQSVCTACPLFYTTLTTGQDNVTDCFFTCPAGQYQAGTETVCRQCPVGTYKSLAGTQQCTVCAASFTTRTTGRTAADDCVVPVCTVGNYLDESALQCYQCSKGQFQSNPGQTSCVPCGDGLTTYPNQFGQFGATSQTDCLPRNVCLAGRHNCHSDATCVPGEGSNFDCRCNAEFEGNGYTCTHLCNSATPYCLNNGECGRSPLQCSCPSGYEGARCQTKTDNMAAILGGVFGGLGFLLLLALLIFLIVWCCCRKEEEAIEKIIEEPKQQVLMLQAPPPVTTVIERTEAPEYINAAVPSIIDENPYHVGMVPEKPLNVIYEDNQFLSAPTLYSGGYAPRRAFSVSSRPGYVETGSTVGGVIGMRSPSLNYDPRASGAVFDPGH